MQSWKSYLAVQTLCKNPNPDTTCRLYSDEPQSLHYANLRWASAARKRSHLLHGVSDLGGEVPM